MHVDSCSFLLQYHRLLTVRINIRSDVLIEVTKGKANQFQEQHGREQQQEVASCCACYAKSMGDKSHEDGNLLQVPQLHVCPGPHLFVHDPQ
jgi:hypothetical protein